MRVYRVSTMGKVVEESDTETAITAALRQESYDGDEIDGIKARLDKHEQFINSLVHLLIANGKLDHTDIAHLTRYTKYRIEE